MCEIDIGNPKYMTFAKLVQVRNFITFELFDMRRERHNLSMLTAFTSAPNHARHRIYKLLVWPRRAPKINLSVRTQELNKLLFLKPSKSPAHVSSVWRHSHPLDHFLSGVLFWHLRMTHSPPARVNTCAHVCT